MRIRSHLLLLAFGVVLPVAAFSIFLTAFLVAREQQTFAQGAIERLRSTMNAVDAQVEGQITVLNALAAAPELAPRDLTGFGAVAARVLSSQPSWLDIVVATPDGRRLLDAASPSLTADHPYIVDRGLAARAAKTREPTVGSVIDRPTGHKAVNLAVPVVRGGDVQYVLLAYIRPEFFQTPIERQHIGAGWVSGVVDSNGRFIARVPHVKFDKAGPTFLGAVERAREGWYRGRTTEGLDSYTAHMTSSFTNWSIGIGTPAEEVLAGARRVAWLMGLGIVAALALAGSLALWLSRRVAEPVARIAVAARDIAAGTPIDADGYERVEEVRTVAESLNSAAQAVREREALVEREKQALREADRAKDEFIAMMSHELRNPLAALSSASKLLELLPPEDPRASHARDVIKRQTGHMARLIEDLLDMSRVVMGKAYVQTETFDLAEAATTVVNTWRASAALDGQRVVLDTVAAWVRADRSRVEQIISNLLDNALKFSTPETAVIIRVTPEGGNAKVEVTDKGVGIAPEMMDRVFGLFVQSEQGLARKSGGMGIGLALVKRLTELQGGTVSVASEGAGKGAAFTVRLPLVSAPAAAAEPAHAEVAAAPCRILLIDDNEDMRRTVATSLSLEGHEVREAADGKTALALAAEAAPDVAIVDIGLPEIDGYEVARRLRRNDSTRNIGLVALTGYGQAEDKETAAAAGFDEHLTKPVDTEVLLKAIARADARRRFTPMSAAG